MGRTLESWNRRAPCPTCEAMREVVEAAKSFDEAYFGHDEGGMADWRSRSGFLHGALAKLRAAEGK